MLKNLGACTALLMAGLLGLNGLQAVTNEVQAASDEPYIEPNELLAAPRYGIDKPNIIYILGDNHNAGAMGCAGHPFIQTPGMDRLAREGLMFTRTYNTTPLCSPSRASILTGVYAHNHEVKNNHTPWTGSMKTFLEYLSEGGYSTAFIGKWHMPGEGLPELDFLDLFVSYTHREGQGQYFNNPFIVNGENVPSRKPYITEEITDYAIEFIEKSVITGEAEKKPFAIYLAHRPGHPPFQAPDDIKGIYDGEDLSDLLPKHADPHWYGKTRGNVYQGILMGSYQNKYRKYLETLTAMDRDIDRLLNRLDELGLSDNTIVIYMGDNGMSWGDHDHHGIREPYEDSMLLPFLVRAPWLINDPGGTREQIAANIDIGPTLLDLAGLEIPETMDGISLVSVMKEADAESRDALLIELYRYYPINTPSYVGIIAERYKYVEFKKSRSPLLFDLENDPGELTNIYDTAEGKEISQEMVKHLESFNQNSALDYFLEESNADNSSSLLRKVVIFLNHFPFQRHYW
jgi:arylsulfatase A-like enzyme